MIREIVVIPFSAKIHCDIIVQFKYKISSHVSVLTSQNTHIHIIIRFYLWRATEFHLTTAISETKITVKMTGFSA